MHALEELLDSGDIGDKLWLKSVLYKLKTTEIAKSGKYPRMIGDLGVAASLQGFWVTMMIKQAMASEDLIQGGLTARFVKTPDPSSLCDTFAELINPSTTRFMALFSDDSCLSIRQRDGSVHMYNMDIKSCDASHTPALFEYLVAVAPDPLRSAMEILVQQCSLPIRVVDTNDKKRVVILRPVGPRLYSGSTLTTAINNVANYLIGLAIEFRGAYSEEEITDAARSVGYMVKLERCDTYHELQFLKHSPCTDTNGTMRAVLNPGVMLRCIGSCHGDLPGRGPLRPRAEAFQKGVLRGLYPSCRFTFYDNLVKAVARAVVNEDMQAFVRKHADHQADRTEYTIADDELYRRYCLTSAEIFEINTLSKGAGFEVSLATSGLDKILNKDYELNVRTQ